MVPAWFLPATHLRALHSSALGPLAEDLAAAAGAEVAARAVPHVAVVVRRALVQAAPLGGSAFITALTGALHLGVALRGETGRSGLEFTFFSPTVQKVPRASNGGFRVTVTIVTQHDSRQGHGSM